MKSSSGRNQPAPEREWRTVRSPSRRTLPEWPRDDIAWANLGVYSKPQHAAVGDDYCGLSFPANYALNSSSTVGGVSWPQPVDSTQGDVFQREILVSRHI